MADLLQPMDPGDVDTQDVWRLTQELRELKDYAERATRELRRYQQARPAPPARPEDSLPLPPWATNMQMMSPLLFAYEERIAELEAVIERSVSLAEQAQLLAKENDSLRAELQERTEQLRNAQLVAPAPQLLEQDGAGGEELQELYRLSVEQNEALAQQNQLLKVQMERMQQSLSATQQQARDAQARAWEIAQTQGKEQERAEALARQRSAAEARLEVVTGELVEEVRIREQLQVQADSLQHKVRVQKESLDSFKQVYDDHNAVAQDEEERLRADLARTAQVEKDQRSRIVDLERELVETSEQLVAARKESDTSKREAEQMLPVMESMKQRLDDISERHSLVQTKLAEEEKQVDSLTYEKGVLSTSEQALKRQTGRVESRLREEVVALQQQHALAEDSARGAHLRCASELEDRLRQSEKQASELQAKVELVEKQRGWEAAAMSRQNSLHAAEKTRWKDDLEEAQQARLSMQRQVDGLETDRAWLKSELDARATQERQAAGAAASELAAASRSLAQAREEAQHGVTVEAENARLRAELNTERARFADEREADQRRVEDEKRLLERQLHASQARTRKEEQTALELLRAQESLRLRWQAELGLERESLEAQVERLTRENKVIRDKSRGLLKALAARRGSGEEPQTLPGATPHARIRPDIL